MKAKSLAATFVAMSAAVTLTACGGTAGEPLAAPGAAGMVLTTPPTTGPVVSTPAEPTGDGQEDDNPPADDSPGGSTSPGPTSPGPTSPAAEDEVTTEQLSEFVDDIGVAIEVTDAYWRSVWTDTAPYESPTIWMEQDAPAPGLYFSAGRDGADAQPWMEGPACDGRALEDNAFYCADGSDILAWDLVLMQDAFEIGDSFVYFIIAHEWAHAIQYRWENQLQAPGMVMAGRELQADCLAGASIAGAEKAGWLVLEPGDEAEIVSSLTSVADLGPWAEAGDHGSPLERVDFYTAGYTNGIAACFPADDEVDETGSN